MTTPIATLNAQSQFEPPNNDHIQPSYQTSTRIDKIADLERIGSQKIEINDSKAIPEDNEPASFPGTLLNEVTYPEGGLKAWSVVFGSFCGMLAVFGFMNSSESRSLFKARYLSLTK
jgi:hypothetical protein